VAQEEGWLAELLPAGGKLFLDGDSEWARVLARRTRASVVRVGFGEQNDWRAGPVSTTETGVSFSVFTPRREFAGEYELKLLGRHQALNALLALAAAAELGLSPQAARRGLAECKPPKMRLQIWEANGVRVLDDAYNANADSMLVALQTLRDLPCAGRRIAVLGDMAELGEHAAAAHAEIGRRTAELGISNLVAVGKWARQTAEAARTAGLSEVQEFTNVPGAAEAVKNLARSGDLVLLKASRAMGLEQIGDVLRRER
jgi:UDP-N-acetylmuramoyl-tripeptide--D-alanyl-D-alanine ligase